MATRSPGDAPTALIASTSEASETPASKTKALASVWVAAIALFGIFVGFITAGAEPKSLGAALADFPWLVGAGALLGWVLARCAVALMARLGEYPLGQISVSLAVPYASFIIADGLFHASGVIAVVAAGLTVNMAAPGRM